MPPDEAAKRDLVRQWLARAEEDLVACRVLLTQEALVRSALAFHAQQATEKHLKALLTWHEVEFPKTHDLTMTSVRPNGVRLSPPPSAASPDRAERVPGGGKPRAAPAGASTAGGGTANPTQRPTTRFTCGGSSSPELDIGCFRDYSGRSRCGALSTLLIRARRSCTTCCGPNGESPRYAP